MNIYKSSTSFFSERKMNEHSPSCQVIKVLDQILAPGHRNQNYGTCTALIAVTENPFAVPVPFADHHVRKFSRPRTDQTSLVAGANGAATASLTNLTYLSQYHYPQGDFTYLTTPPDRDELASALQELSSYLSILDEVLDELRPLAEKIANYPSSEGPSSHQPSKGSFIVMVSNFGHSDMMMNYFCAAQRAGMDLRKVLLFATDVKTKELAESMGVVGAVYHHAQLFASIPSDASMRFGDVPYSKIMMSKIYCVHLISMLRKYNFLFQDVDIIPYQARTLDFFVQKAAQEEEYDILFQHDFNFRLEYAPWYVSV